VTAAERARWLSEVSDALERADDLLVALTLAQGVNALAIDVSARLAAARAEVRALRLGRYDRHADEVRPEWMNRSPWQAAGPAD
jgi:acyl-CoA reductase-like NAD-dependent aldehyde dehydrogenase